MDCKDKRKPDLNWRPLSFTEAAFLTDNLETIERFRELQRKAEERAAYDTYAPLSFDGKVFMAILALIVLYAAGFLAWAVIGVLFMLWWGSLPRFCIYADADWGGGNS